MVPGTRTFEAWDRNRETSRERFPYARCRTCGTVFLVAPPADLARYYAERLLPLRLRGRAGLEGRRAAEQAASYRVELLRAHTEPGRLIEIGAGTGAFAVAAQAAGFQVSAIEMSERCCRYLSEREAIEAICSDRPLEAIASLAPARAVALWHVLEHLRNPAEVLARVAEKVEPGGVLALAVPNPRSLQFRLLRTRWVHLDAPRHLCLMPPAALIDRGRELGMRCVALRHQRPRRPGVQPVGVGHRIATSARGRSAVMARGSCGAGDVRSIGPSGTHRPSRGDQHAAYAQGEVTRRLGEAARLSAGLGSVGCKRALAEDLAQVRLAHGNVWARTDPA